MASSATPSERASSTASSRPSRDAFRADSRGCTPAGISLPASTIRCIASCHWSATAAVCCVISSQSMESNAACDYPVWAASNRLWVNSCGVEPGQPARVPRPLTKANPSRCRHRKGCEVRHAVGVAGFEPTTSSSRTKRATKLRHTPRRATTAYRTGSAGGQMPARSCASRERGHGCADQTWVAGRQESRDDADRLRIRG
jgi:hypothetical protein